MISLGNVLRRDHMTDQPAAAEAPADEKPKLNKKLPTDRIKVSRQFDLLRAYASASGNGQRPVHYSEAAKLLQMNPGTAGMLNGFLVENGFVERSGNNFIPATAVNEYARAYSWNPESAARKLLPLMRASWFGQIFERTLSFRPMRETEVIEALAQDAAAGPDYKAQLGILIDYAEIAGLLRREGDQVILIHEAIGDTAEPTARESQQSKGVEAPRAVLASPFAMSGISSDGTIQFHISVKVSMAEFAGWSAEQMTAFFGGIAQMLAAQEKVQKS